MNEVAFSAADPFFIVLNARSGRTDAEDAETIIRRVLTEAGRPHELFVVTRPGDLPDFAARAVAAARRDGGAIIAAGGDGTLNAVAQAALGSGRPFGVLPQGTFNYFGRCHGIPVETEAATRLLLESQVQPTQVGLMNERVFLVNASLGLYPKILEDREAFKKHHGRSRFNALVSGLHTLARERRQLVVELELGDESVTVRTPTVFVGNNALQLERIGLPEARRVERGRLAAVVVRPVTSAAMLRLLLRGALGRLGEAENVVHFAFRRLTVRPGPGFGRTSMQVAYDGEVAWARPPIVFEAAPDAMPMLLPERRAAGEAATG